MKKQNEGIMGSRQAAESFINAGIAQEESRRKRKKAPKAGQEDDGLDWTDWGVEHRGEPLRNGEEPTDENIAKAMKKDSEAVDNFLRAGKRKNTQEDAFSLYSRISDMSDEDFDKGVADGSITPEMIRKAGEYAREVWDEDVWSETDAGENTPLPPYDEFFSNLDKYGYDTKTDYHKYSRYNPNRYKAKE